MKIGVGAMLYGLRPIIDFMTFNFSMQAILLDLKYLKKYLERDAKKIRLV